MSSILLKIIYLERLIRKKKLQVLFEFRARGPNWKDLVVTFLGPNHLPTSLMEDLQFLHLASALMEHFLEGIAL